MPLELTIMGIVLAAVSGLPGLALSRTSGRGQQFASLLMLAAAACGLTGAGLVLAGVAAGPARFLAWPPPGGSLLGLDALGAFFLVPVFLLGGLGAVYGHGYWPQRRHPGNGRLLRLFWGLLVAGMGLLLIGRHALAFLLGWEFMALSAFFLVSAENEREESRRAGWIYLVATHIGTLALFALFALWHAATGSYLLEPAPTGTVGTGMMNAMFLLALLGFGLKAGVMPLHFWLPGAHANAPTHVSAMLSGVVLKMGIYGLLRWCSLWPAPPAAWGGLILLLGAASSLFGVAFAIAQHDLKRLLAYHSIENIGIILLGLGLALLGLSAGRPAWVVLGLAGCLLHVWNHFLFKALLFLGAGSVILGAGTRQIDALGGLAKRQPWTAAMFLTGAVAICGLPPLNGFVSEWLVYLGLLRTAAEPGLGAGLALVAAPVLAVTGALALACFVKVYGAVFLGAPRSAAAAGTAEAPASMRLPMLALATGCAVIGLLPGLVVPVLERVTACWHGSNAPAGMALAAQLPLTGIGLLSALLFLILALCWLCCRNGCRTAGQAPTWDCGYAAPDNRMQYTASSLARSLVGLFAWILRPHQWLKRPTGLFPAAPGGLHTHVDEVALDRALLPFAERCARFAARFRRFQHGLVQPRLLYILITVILLLATLIPFKEILGPWFRH